MFARKTTLAAILMFGVAFGVAGCEQNRDEMRPDMDKIVSGEPGLQSRDLREMTERMAPDLLQIPEIVRNPNRVVVVMKSIQNKTESEPGRDLDIYVAKLKTLLNSSKCRDRIAFVETAADLGRIQGEELGGTGNPFGDEGRGPAVANPRVKPQFALWGTFYSKHDRKTTYYLCTFRLTDLNSGVQVWEGSYDVRTLN